MILCTDEGPEVMTCADADEITILELSANHRDSVHNGAVPATFVPDEQLVFQTHNARMIAGDRRIVDHDVIRGVATDRAEISILEPVVSNYEVLEPQFDLEHG